MAGAAFHPARNMCCCGVTATPLIIQKCHIPLLPVPPSFPSSFLRLPGKPWGTSGWEPHSVFSGTIFSKGKGSCAGLRTHLPWCEPPPSTHLGQAQMKLQNNRFPACSISAGCGQPVSFAALPPGREMPGMDGKGNQHRVSTLGEEAGERETWQQLLFIF